MPTVTNSNHKITFTYQGKDYTTNVFRMHQVAAYPKYVIKFKSGTRHLMESQDGVLYVKVGDPLDQELLDAIQPAIKEIEELQDQRFFLSMGYSVHEEYLK